MGDRNQSQGALSSFAQAPLGNVLVCVHSTLSHKLTKDIKVQRDKQCGRSTVAWPYVALSMYLADTSPAQC